MFTLLHWLWKKWCRLLGKPVLRTERMHLRLFIDGKEIPVVKAEVTHPSRPMDCTYRQEEPTVIRLGKFKEGP